MPIPLDRPNLEPLTLLEEPKLVIVIPGKPVSGNHRTGERTIPKDIFDVRSQKMTRKWVSMKYTTKEGREYMERIRSIARYEALKCRWKTPQWAWVSLTLYNINMDRDNVHKTVCDALQGIAFPGDSRILDGPLTKRKDDRGVRVEVVIRPVDPALYGYR